MKIICTLSTHIVLGSKEILMKSKVFSISILLAIVTISFGFSHGKKKNLLKKYEVATETYDHVITIEKSSHVAYMPFVLNIRTNCRGQSESRFFDLKYSERYCDISKSGHKVGKSGVVQFKVRKVDYPRYQRDQRRLGPGKAQLHCTTGQPDIVVVDLEKLCRTNDLFDSDWTDLEGS